MICDDDRALAERLVAALRAAGHEAETCRHTMDVLRDAAAGRFELIAFGLDMAGFSRTGAVEALREIAPRVPLIALHERPSEIVRTLSTRARFIAVLPRSLTVEDFMYAVACALSEPPHSRRRRPAAVKQDAVYQEEPARNNQPDQGNF
jgi:DNA-binding NtrC family response regulator